MSNQQQAEDVISAAYAAYDSDPRVGGPDDYDAFKEACEAIVAHIDGQFAAAVDATEEPVNE